MNSIEQNLPVSSMEEPTKELLSSTLNSVTGRSTVFDRKTTLQLIACVRKRPILWDRQFLRKRLSSCQLEWEYIQQKEFPSYTVDQLKARWKTMRDSFRREIKRIEFGEFAQSRWPLYEDMLFLDGHYRLKKSLQHKIPAPLAKRKATARRSEDSVAVEPKKEVAIDHSTSCTIGKAHNNEREREHQQPTSSVTIADVNDAPVGISEVTYSNKFRSRIKSENTVPESTQEVRYTGPHDITDGQFLMSLVPFMRMLPLETNLEIRLKVLHLIANATKNVNVSQKHSNAIK